MKYKMFLVILIIKDIIRLIKDPEHPYYLEQLGIVKLSDIKII